MKRKSFAVIGPESPEANDRERFSFHESTPFPPDHLAHEDLAFRIVYPRRRRRYGERDRQCERADTAHEHQRHDQHFSDRRIMPRLAEHAARVSHREPHGALSLIHISEPTRRTPISYAVF